jgi:putative two-component system response regulator
MAIVDVYDALTNDRPYKKAFSHEMAIDIIEKGLGTQFDPVLCKLFLDNNQSFTSTDTGNDNLLVGSVDLDPAMVTLTNAVGTRNGKELGHADRMKQYLEILYDAILEHSDMRHEISSWNKDIFLMSAQLHDVGKLSVSDQILNKTGKLTDAEFSDVKSHTDFGVKAVQQMKETAKSEELMLHAERLTGSHHEKWDGTGYPDGLKGTDIPVEGRLMAIVDVYDALISKRPYKEAFSHDVACEIIESGAGSHFDPALVKVFMKVKDEFDRIVREAYIG